MMRFFSFLLVLLITASAHGTSLAEMVSIDRTVVNMRSGPGKQYSVTWHLPKGYPLKVIKKKRKWIKVRDFEDYTGWVYRPLVNRKPHLIVKAERANMRSGPGKSFHVIDTVDFGTIFKTLRHKGGWVKVMREDGTTGWVYRKLLWGW
ncbi:MAG TPA: peptide-binding protein [Thermodesulfobacteriaceae bacterium]|nr:peptide-binding protein [Thermodesulfobacteriaceae bacterium]